MSNNNNNDDDDATKNDVKDNQLIEQADREAAEQRLLGAAKLLQQVQDRSLLQEQHHTILRWADEFEIAIHDLQQEPDDVGWKKQGESHGDHDFIVYYRVDPETYQLSCRIDSVIDPSLFIPVISVFHESDLFQTWMPSYEKPIQLGIRETKMLKEMGRANQLIQVIVDMAWPLLTREVIMHAMAIDVIDEQGLIAVRAKSETTEDDSIIPEPDDKVVRIDFENDMVFRKCPKDHPCLVKSNKKKQQQHSDSSPPTSMVLLSLRATVDAHVRYVPLRLINFVTRTVLGRLWGSNLKVAEEIRDGQRPRHQEAIESKKDLYEWIEQRVTAMMMMMEGGGGEKTEEEAN